MVVAVAPSSVPTSGSAVSPDTSSNAANAAVKTPKDGERKGPVRTIDELLRRRAKEYPSTPIVSYPLVGVEYVDYTYKQLDVFAYRVAEHLQAYLPRRPDSSTKRSIVALLGPSNLEYLITILSIIKLGHTVMMLSTRIPAIAIESLVNTTGATYLIADPKYLEMANAVKGECPELQILNMPTRSVFEFSLGEEIDTQLDGQLDVDAEREEIMYIIHSSGSTGLPKPIYQKQEAALANFSTSMNMKTFMTLPLYHNHGVCNTFRAIYCRKPMYLYNADLPLTSHHLVSALRNYEFELLSAVPYALKLLAESDDGLKLMAKLKIVMYGGSACPDDLGDLLVENGVNLVSHYGATEVGQLMTSFRPEGDKDWNYVREGDKVHNFLRWIPQGSNLYECCVLPGWPSKTATNMDDGSYRTKDMFEPHPTIPRAWKYIARQDDTIVLVNGEKFNPVVTEGKIRSNKLVAEAVVFGAQRPCLGILVVPSAETAGMQTHEVVDLIWPLVEASQASNDAFAKLSKDMVVVLPHDVDYPRTDKGSIIRFAFYKAFAKEIEEAYERYDSANGNTKEMTETELRGFLRELILKAQPQARDLADDTDFFSLGLDSLNAIQMRAEIVKRVKVTRKLKQNVVFDHPSVTQLTDYLLGTEKGSSIVEEMTALARKFSVFTKRVSLSGQYVVVTGATGSLGAHIVAALTRNPAIQRVYCFVRARDRRNASRRVVESLIHRKIYHDLSLSARRKIIALPTDLSKEDFGLSADGQLEVISSRLGAVIHAAWPVNFNLSLSSFEDTIKGVRNLINLAQIAEASFNFCSSISAVVRHPDENGPVPECEPDPRWAQGMGYAQAKSVAETICARAAEKAGIPVRVLRIGQIVGDTVNGVWNATEAIPLMMQSALTIGALPKLPETPAWLPVDVVAKGVVDISLSESSSTFTNIVNHRAFSWSDDLLPALRNAGLNFDEVEPGEWVRRLRESNPDPVLNPPIKLVDFFASKYDRNDIAPSKKYETSKARALSPALENAPVLDQAFVDKFVGQFLTSDWQVKQSLPSEPEESSKTKVITFVSGEDEMTVAGLADLLTISLDSLLIQDGRVIDGSADGGTEPENFVIPRPSMTRFDRDTIRRNVEREQPGAKLIFLDLQSISDAGQKKIDGVDGEKDGVNGKYARIGADETDIYPLDAEADPGDICDEAIWRIRHV